MNVALELLVDGFCYHWTEQGCFQAYAKLTCLLVVNPFSSDI